MKKLFSVLVFLMIIFCLQTKPVFSQIDSSAVSSAILASNLFYKDERREILKMFLEKYDSPLSPYAEEFIDAADFYRVDWRLLPAIAGTESSFGKRIPYNSYNAYGWDNGNFKFSSWKHSIWYVTSQLRLKYLNHGLTDVSQIGRIYAPPSKTWAENVRFFMKKIETTKAPRLNL